MYTKIKKINSNGFTLIEIIASIAILGLVIAVFLPIFPQMMSWSKNADNELVASNLLSQVANDIKENEVIFNDIKINLVEDHHYNCERNQTYSIQRDALDTLPDYDLNKSSYDVAVEVCQSNEYKEKELGLYRTHIKIQAGNPEKTISDTYFYLTEDGGTNEEI
ncbi:type II secretion system protein [Virgibacillus indicus]|uniref:type II secretion system protein n=1 Tax=Virgibacillus indicus TaxID=2024554 RepID=UPI0013FDFA88|nr:type II secretion system protein [Virgibacillus indicus]